MQKYFKEKVEKNQNKEVFAKKKLRKVSKASANSRKDATIEAGRSLSFPAALKVLQQSNIRL